MVTLCEVSTNYSAVKMTDVAYQYSWTSDESTCNVTLHYSVTSWLCVIQIYEAWCIRGPPHVLMLMASDLTAFASSRVTHPITSFYGQNFIMTKKHPIRRKSLTRTGPTLCPQYNHREQLFQIFFVSSYKRVRIHRLSSAIDKWYKL